MVTTHRSNLVEQLEKALTDEAYDGGHGAMNEEQFRKLVRTLAATAAEVIDETHVPAELIVGADHTAAKYWRRMRGAESEMHARELHHFESEKTIAEAVAACDRYLAVKVADSTEADAAAAGVAAALRSILAPALGGGSEPEPSAEHEVVPTSPTGRIDSPVTCEICGRALFIGESGGWEHVPSRSEPQGEPSDAALDAAMRTLDPRGLGGREGMRAALRAAAAVTEQGENR